MSKFIAKSDCSYPPTVSHLKFMVYNSKGSVLGPCEIKHLDALKVVFPLLGFDACIALVTQYAEESTMIAQSVLDMIYNRSPESFGYHIKYADCDGEVAYWQKCGLVIPQ